MRTMAKAKHARTISAHVPNKIAEELERRASGVNQRLSRYIADLLVKWYEDGAKPISDLDAFAEGKKAKSTGRGRVGKPTIAEQGGPKLRKGREEPDERKGKAQ